MKSKYVNNIDALRAVAILLVMTFHAHLLAVGWVGVWMFFVISGFLIIRSLLSLSDLGFWEALKVFYIRRSLRIWPAYYLFLAAAVAISLPRHDNGNLGRQLAFAVPYLYNFMTFLPNINGGQIFSHLWSLSVEEQFYLIIAPIVIMFGRKTVRFFMIMICLEPILRGVFFNILSHYYTNFESAAIIYSLTPFQVDSFCVGGIIAILEPWIMAQRKSLILKTSLFIYCAYAGIAALNMFMLNKTGLYPRLSGQNLDFVSGQDLRLTWSSFGMPGDMFENGGYVWLYTALSLAAGATLVLMMVFGGNRKFPLLNAIGRVSYGMYLYHMPMISGYNAVIHKLGVHKWSPLGLLCFLFFIVAVWAVAWVSFTYVEQPFLRLKKKIEPAMAPAS